MRILVVEDEPLLADAVAAWLRGDAHAVDVADDGAAALHRWWGWPAWSSSWPH